MDRACRTGLLAVALALVSAMPAGGDASVEIAQLIDASVKADLSGDRSFYEKILSTDYTLGTGFGWETRESKLARLEAIRAGDPANRIGAEKVSNLKVRRYGDTAIATFDDALDVISNGEHRTGTALVTQAWVRRAGEWKLVAAHTSLLAK